MPVILLWGIPTLFVVAGGGWCICITSWLRARSASADWAFFLARAGPARCVPAP
jgi:hypothetical protein